MPHSVDVPLRAGQRARARTLEATKRGEASAPSRGAGNLAFARGSDIDRAVGGLDFWFETVRGDGGYGGPVVHWWEQCLMYAGRGLDWRYEGIISGYLTLWERTQNRFWLERATRAGDDLLRGQRADGHFHASGFEKNPTIAGTPHEAACSLGLLKLAEALKAENDTHWQSYFHAASLNLERFWVAKLWDEATRSFSDDLRHSTFVPNKAATAAEAMFQLSSLTGDERWAEQFALPTMERVTRFQSFDKPVTAGGIAQNSIGSTLVEKYFPLYIARCIPALVDAYQHSGNERFLEAAGHAIRFVERWTDDSGSIPTVIYADGSAAWSPTWCAPLGDILRAADLLVPFGITTDFEPMACRLLAAQDTTGGFQTATGFASHSFSRVSNLPDLRDLLHVAGWCDKAFRYLAGYVTPEFKAAPPVGSLETECTFRGKRLRMVETPAVLEFVDQGQTRYRWRKGESSPEIAEKEFWLR